MAAHGRHSHGHNHGFPAPHRSGSGSINFGEIDHLALLDYNTHTTKYHLPFRIVFNRPLLKLDFSLILKSQFAPCFVDHASIRSNCDVDIWVVVQYDSTTRTLHS